MIRLDDAAEEEIFAVVDDSRVEASQMTMFVVNAEVGQSVLRQVVHFADRSRAVERETIVRESDKLVNLK